MRLGLRGLSASEVLSGLSAGDEILVDATASLADGARVRTIQQAAPFANTDADKITTANDKSQSVETVN